MHFDSATAYHQRILQRIEDLIERVIEDDEYHDNVHIYDIEHMIDHEFLNEEYPREIEVITTVSTRYYISITRELCDTYMACINALNRINHVKKRNCRLR